MTTHFKLRAYGKINLGLDVLRKREDGYHDVRMIMQTVGLYDQIDLFFRQASGIQIETNLPYLPVNENNLVYKAAQMLMEEFQVTNGVFIRLRKMIPVAAGMAGGSSDAAAVLVGINKMFHLGLSMEELMERGVKIGADVPYCIMRGTALSEGIGEKLTALPPMPQCQVLLAKPAISVSTKYVYENLCANSLKPQQHPDIDGMIEAIGEGNLLEGSKHLGNVLELVTARKYPVIEEIKNVMRRHGALGALMSGSGPTVFGIFDSREKMEQAAAVLRESKLAKTVFATEVF